jgi:hypothetical protein
MNSFKKYVSFILPCILFALLINIPPILSFYSQQPTSNIKIIKQKFIDSSDNIPRSGSPLKIGIYLNSEYSPKKVEEKIDSKINIMAWFSKWSEPLANNKISYACENGYVPAITWESWKADTMTADPYPLADIAKGKFDSYLNEQFNLVKNACGRQTVLIRFDHEMHVSNHDLWYPWQNDPANYVKAWQHIVDLSHKINQNVKWIWSPNHGEELIYKYYPGDKWVDYIGVTMNRNMFYANRYMPDFKTFYEESQPYIESFNKPIIISETGSDENSENLDKAKWVKSMFDYADKNPKITAILMLNELITIVNQDNYIADYRIDSSPSALSALKQSLSSINRSEDK